MRKPSELTAEFGENITWAFRRDVSSVIMKTEFKGAALTPYGDREYNYEIRVEDGHGWIGLLTIKTAKKLSDQDIIEFEQLAKLHFFKDVTKT